MPGSGCWRPRRQRLSPARPPCQPRRALHCGAGREGEPRGRAARPGPAPSSPARLPLARLGSLCPGSARFSLPQPLGSSPGLPRFGGAPPLPPSPRLPAVLQQGAEGISCSIFFPSFFSPQAVRECPAPPCPVEPASGLFIRCGGSWRVCPPPQPEPGGFSCPLRLLCMLQEGWCAPHKAACGKQAAGHPEPTRALP